MNGVNVENNSFLKLAKNERSKYERWLESRLQLSFEADELVDEELVYTSCSFGKISLVFRCVQGGYFDLNSRSKVGHTILMKALQNRDDTAILTLLAFRDKLDLEITNKSGNTALAYCMGKFNRYYHLLIQAGVNVDATFSVGETSYYRCLLEGNYLGACMLLSAGANPTFGSTPGFSAYLPRIEATRHKIRAQVKLWLAGLDAAKLMLNNIFDNEELEKEICTFIFTEDHLRRVLCINVDTIAQELERQ